MFGWVEDVRTFGRAEAARLFGWGRNAEADERAKMLGRMIALIVHSLRTKSYEEFVVRFSNPGQEPDALQRFSRKAQFQMRVSPTCWYDATVSYADERSPSLHLAGGGDDFGVLVTAAAAADGARVSYDPADWRKPGRDARAVVRALLRLPGYRSFRASDDSLGILPDFPS